MTPCKMTGMQRIIPATEHEIITDYPNGGRMMIFYKPVIPNWLLILFLRTFLLPPYTIWFLINLQCKCQHASVRYYEKKSPSEFGHPYNDNRLKVLHTLNDFLMLSTPITSFQITIKESSALSSGLSSITMR